MYRLDYAGGLDCEGPLGFKMASKGAAELEVILKSVPPAGYRRYEVDGTYETDPVRRSDISWISIESPDKQREVVMADGCNDAIIRKSNNVTINHQLPAIGTSLWRKTNTTAEKKGVIARTRYFDKAEMVKEGFDERDRWVGDRIFDLIVQKSLTGKSVGILPVPESVRGPTQQEVDANPDWQGCKVYARSYLVEYAVCPRPVHPEALTITVQKAFPEEADELLELLGLPRAVKKAEPVDDYRKIKVIPVSVIADLVRQKLVGVDMPGLAQTAAKQALYKATGRIT